MIRWLSSRVGVIYLIVFIFCVTSMDLKMLQERIKVRRLNDAIPDFSDMIVFSKNKSARKNIDWKPYRDYFRLIYAYLPKDVIIKELLGYVDYYSGHEQEAIVLFKDSTAMSGKFLFISNYDLGVINYKRGMWAQASQYLLKAIESNPKLAVMLMQSSTVYRQICSSPYFRYALNAEIGEGRARAYILLLSSLYHMHQYNLMIAVAKMGLAEAALPDKDALYYESGLAFYELGDLKRAFVLFQQSIALEKNNPYPYFYMANIFEKAGQLEQSKGLLQASYALHQRNDPRFPYDKEVELCFF